MFFFVIAPCYIGDCYVYSSKINALHSEKVIISGVKVFISRVESNSTKEYYSRMPLAWWGSWMIPLVVVDGRSYRSQDEICRLHTWCHVNSKLPSCIGNAPSR